MVSFIDQAAIHRAGTWFLHSGIQDPHGGVARYYRIESQENLPVSSEITGYAVSALIFLHERTGNPDYLTAALQSATFLRDVAWDAANNTFPFEPGSDKAYFFDLGIIGRGLMAAFRATGDASFRNRAHDGALSLGFDFLGDAEFYPVISLPMKEPLPFEPRWSRKPGCYQLKSALIWHDLGEEHGVRMFEVALAMGLATHQSFLSGESDREKVMDRLHAYCYFLEALLAATGHAEAREALAWGILRTGELLRDIAPEFERSDVNAQLLRVRLIAHHLGVVPLDATSACEEARRTSEFQASTGDPRVAGGFWFGRKRSQMLPFSNPVSTAFCIQALMLWDDHVHGRWNFQLSQLI